MPMRIGTPMPSFDGATNWFNGSGEQAAAELSGQVTLVHFWSVSCHLCKDNLPLLKEWRVQYGPQGLRLVAVHMPRYPADLDEQMVKEAVVQYEIVEPCALDHGHRLRDAFLNEQGFVPAYYLFDAEHKLKSFAAGERGLHMVQAALNRVLARE